ncbi:PREDICTED: pyrroline-5-carboxylate reductase 1-like [Vollenhovia emeryi]|uniref:pyrroline-5-carboxylate reductase 1-like n=1 Tax=Vollenhovia emeryi TaxID=411798 RepID=UPI0005F3D63A|nr:PREDICTED: pyrroline-5-carboxylate reductase 1-like [Vollenhovia emeryi]
MDQTMDIADPPLPYTGIRATVSHRRPGRAALQRSRAKCKERRKTRVLAVVAEATASQIDERPKDHLNSSASTIPYKNMDQTVDIADTPTTHTGIRTTVSHRRPGRAALQRSRAKCKERRKTRLLAVVAEATALQIDERPKDQQEQQKQQEQEQHQQPPGQQNLADKKKQLQKLQQEMRKLQEEIKTLQNNDGSRGRGSGWNRGWGRGRGRGRGRDQSVQ